MPAPSAIPTPVDVGAQQRAWLSRAALGIAWGAMAAVFLLMSPPGGQEYPGAIPWRDGSWLKAIIDWLSLGGRYATARGVEIKDLALFLATSAALALFSLRAWLSGRLPADRKTAKGAWFASQALLSGWVAISAASAYWSHDAATALGQAALYGMMLAWAVCLGWTLESRHLPRLLGGYVAITTAAAILCIWYYYERLPGHRPGFPLGNPSVLATCVFPALLLCAALILAELSRSRSGARPRLLRVALLALALLPLAWCFFLTGSRGAWMGLLGGLFGVLFLLADRRQRWWIGAVLLLIASLALWRYSASTQDMAMARGATIRFRMYAWTYAASLWWERPITGSGAGAYPRRAGTLSAGDRALDPAAFMGDLVEHAHNELFEVLAEIGLIGGLTFVAGHVALLTAATGLLRLNHSPQRRWILMGLLAAICGLLADAMFGVALRLPGAPVVYFTLVGALWAACRAVSRVALDDAAMEMWRRRMQPRRTLLCVVGALLGLGAGVLSWRNWQGALAEQRAVEALLAGDPARALFESTQAEERLLDPVRKLLSRDRMVRSLLDLARRVQGSASRDNAVERRNAIHLAEQAFGAAVAASQLAPALLWLPGYAAQAAELLETLNRESDSEAARHWWAAALHAWRSQRTQRPYDVQALLALSRYPTPIGDYVGLLREALRGEALAGQTRSRAWDDAFARAATAPGFAETLAALLQSVRPYTSETNTDNLMITHAPEIYRLNAAWNAAHGNFSAAAADAEQAALLYEPLRVRIPNGVSVALAEQATLLLQSSPEAGAKAVQAARQAIAELPPIQADQRELLAQPSRLLLVKASLAVGDEAAAREELRRTGCPPEQLGARLAAHYVELAQLHVRSRTAAGPARRWLESALKIEPSRPQAWAWLIWLDARDTGLPAAEARLRAAEAAGVSAAVLSQIRDSLGKEFPSAPAKAGPE